MDYNIRMVDETLESTAECVALLNKIKPSSWKRKSKFNLTVSYGDKNTVRVFSDGTDNITLINTGEYTLVCVDLDLSVHKPLIDEINKVAKNFWTHDYGDIWFNPYKIHLWVVGGDGGIWYSEKSAAAVSKMIQDGDLDFAEDEEFTDRIPGLKSIQTEGEHSPSEYYDPAETEIDDDEQNFIKIGCIRNDIEW